MVDLHGVPGEPVSSLVETGSPRRRLTSSLFASLPGSQNGFDNSGLKSTNGPQWGSSKSNFDRSLEALGVLTKFVTDEKYLGVVKA